MRRELLVTMLFLASTSSAVAADNPKPATEAKSVLEFKTKSLAGKEVDLTKYKGKVLLIVNTASHCGCTPQYKDLQALHEKYNKEGLAILAFPCNQFGLQEPGSAEQIQEFCTSKYNVSFDLFEKIDVNGPKQHPLYKWLEAEMPSDADRGNVKWNFEKFLIGRDGKVIARYRSFTIPSDKKVVNSIEAALKG